MSKTIYKNLKPVTRKESYWAAMADDSITPPEPQTTEECILAAMSGNYPVDKIEPQTREQGLMKKAVEATQKAMEQNVEWVDGLSGEFAFDDADGNLLLKDMIKEIKIPYGITSVGKNAFEGFSKLDKVKIPDTVTEICEGAFRSCGFVKVSIPASVKKLGGNAFSLNSSLKYVHLPNDIDVGDYDTETSATLSAFGSCSELIEITCPNYSENVETTVKNAAFYGVGGCPKLTKVEVPYGVTVLGGMAGCGKLTEVKIPPTVKTIDSGFGGCTSLKSIVLPASVESIANSAFAGSGLTEIIIKKPENSISGAPWGATNAEVIWNG